MKNGCYLNIDSLADARLTAEVAEELDVEARLLIRINSECDMSSTGVHDYNQTANKKSKFGVTEGHLQEVREYLKYLIFLDQIVSSFHFFSAFFIIF